MEPDRRHGDREHRQDTTHRAGGGPVRAGQAYTVGEAGEETFVATQDGVILQHQTGTSGAGGRMDLNVTVNIGDGFALLDERGAERLGVMVADGVHKQLLVKQSRADLGLKART